MSKWLYTIVQQSFKRSAMQRVNAEKHAPLCRYPAHLLLGTGHPSAAWLGAMFTSAEKAHAAA